METENWHSACEWKKKIVSFTNNKTNNKQPRLVCIKRTWIHDKQQQQKKNTYRVNALYRRLPTRTRILSCSVLFLRFCLFFSVLVNRLFLARTLWIWICKHYQMKYEWITYAKRKKRRKEEKKTHQESSVETAETDTKHTYISVTRATHSAVLLVYIYGSIAIIPNAWTAWRDSDRHVCCAALICMHVWVYVSMYVSISSEWERAQR